MGLSHSVSSKCVKRYGSQAFRIAAICMQGYRPDQEDTHSIVLPLPSHPKSSFFAVFDGHRGRHAAEYCEKYMHQQIDALKEFTPESLTKALLNFDRKFLMQKAYSPRAGCTATFCIVSESENDTFEVIAVNVGDSRSLLKKNDGTVIPLTVDHKPTLESETKRIEAAGGYVTADRVNGHLSLSRAFGDRDFKDNADLKPHEQLIIAVPDVTVETASKGDYLLLACDGLFEKMTNEQVMDALIENEKAGNEIGQILVNLLDLSLERGSRDNMTAILIHFEDGTDVSQPDQFLPGPYDESWDENFKKAYISDAQKHGFTLQQVLEMNATSSSPL